MDMKNDRLFSPNHVLIEQAIPGVVRPSPLDVVRERLRVSMQYAVD